MLSKTKIELIEEIVELNRRLEENKNNNAQAEPILIGLTREQANINIRIQRLKEIVRLVQEYSEGKN
jgi:hypothetical protein